MRYSAILLVAVICGCESKSGTTSADGSPATQATAPDKKGKAELGLPWSEGTANQKLIGLTDDEVEALIGKPDSKGPDPTAPAWTQWIYSEKKWIKASDGSATAMGLVLAKGRVRSVYMR